VQPYSGSPANLAVYFAFLKPGDKVMGLALPMGGHLTHGWNVSITGRYFQSVQYGVRKDTGRIDLDEVRDLARRERPSCCGPGAPRTRACGTLPPWPRSHARWAPASQWTWPMSPAWWQAAPIRRRFHTPTVVTTTTHKTLRGPRGGMILCRAVHASALDKAVFPGLQGGPHDHTTAGIAVALHEASQPAFREYAQNVVKNASVLAAELMARGYHVVSGGTDNHLILVDLTNKNITGKIAAKALDRAGMELNYNSVPMTRASRSTRPASGSARPRSPVAAWAPSR